jgi:hypothetical protein
MLLPVLQRAFNDPREAVWPVVPVAGDYAHARTFALNNQAMTVVFDFVELGFRLN